MTVQEEERSFQRTLTSLQNRLQWVISRDIPWIQLFRRPKLDFRRPTFELPHRAPQNYLLAFLLLFTIFLLAGGIYNLTENPQPMGYTQQTGFLPVYTALNEQFLLESLAAGIFIAIGAAGLFLIRFATRYAYDTRYATSLLLVGCILIGAGFMGAFIMLERKI